MLAGVPPFKRVLILLIYMFALVPTGIIHLLNKLAEPLSPNVTFLDLESLDLNQN